MRVQKSKPKPPPDALHKWREVVRLLSLDYTQYHNQNSSKTYPCSYIGLPKSSADADTMLCSTAAAPSRSPSRAIPVRLAAQNKNQSVCIDYGEQELSLAAIAAADDGNDISMSNDPSTSNDDDDHDDDDSKILAEDREDSISIDDESYSSEKEVSTARDEDDHTYGGGEVPGEIIHVSKADVPTRWEGGRRYQDYVPQGYHYPNDQEEQLRLDIMHTVVTSKLNCLFLAPGLIQSPGGVRILDIGTGTGIWAIEMAEKYPEAFITGIDLSAIQPAMLPRNVDILIDDAESYLAREENRETFDYIHCRSIGSESITSWETLIKNIHKVLKPGGWVEFQEFSTNFTSDNEIIDEDHAFRRLAAAMTTACGKIGRHFDPTPNFESWLKQREFMNVQKKTFRIPIEKEVKTSFKQLVPDTTALLRRQRAKEDILMLDMELREALAPRAPLVCVDYVGFTAQKSREE